MAKYKAYPEYKKISSLWVDVIPSHWMCILFKRVVSEIKDGTHGTHGRVELGRPLLSAKNVQNHGIEINESESFISEREYNEITRNGFPKKNDLLITCVGTIGRSCVYKFLEPIAFQRSVAFLRLSVDACPYFYKYYVESKPYQCQLEAASKASAQSGVYMGDLVNTLTVCPPINEQKGIAKFLHHETAKIDNLIEKQQQLIELLKEKRQAVISHAVTKGLNPDVPMKDSGVQWLGEVPAHWIKQKLVNVSEGSRGSFVNGPFGSDLLAEELRDHGVPVVYIRDIKPTGYSRKSTVFVTPMKAKQLDVCKLEPGNVVVSKVGDPPGDACVYPVGEPSAIITQDVIRIRVNIAQFSPDFIAYLLNSDFGRMVVNDISVEGTRKRVSLGDFKSTRFVFPPLKESLDIVRYLNSECEKLSCTIAKATQAVAFMQERRTALISAAVTGKIDVRDWVAPDTQDTKEPQEATA